jgi:hypothetical protein
MKRRLALQLPALLFFFFTLCACTRTGTGHVYNLTTGEMFTFTYTFNGRGRGTINAVTKTGERLNGEYSVVQGGNVSWGSVYASVYSPAGTASGNANSVGVTSAGARRGAAILTGDEGSILDCEFVVGMNGHGTGACRGKDDTKYRMMF